MQWETKDELEKEWLILFISNIRHIYKVSEVL